MDLKNYVTAKDVAVGMITGILLLAITYTLGGTLGTLIVGSFLVLWAALAAYRLYGDNRELEDEGQEETEADVEGEESAEDAPAEAETTYA